MPKVVKDTEPIRLALRYIRILQERSVKELAHKMQITASSIYVMEDLSYSRSPTHKYLEKFAHTTEWRIDQIYAFSNAISEINTTQAHIIYKLPHYAKAYLQILQNAQTHLSLIHI